MGVQSSLTIMKYSIKIIIPKKSGPDFIMYLSVRGRTSWSYTTANRHMREYLSTNPSLQVILEKN